MRIALANDLSARNRRFNHVSRNVFIYKPAQLSVVCCCLLVGLVWACGSVGRLTLHSPFVGVLLTIIPNRMH